MGQRTSNVCEIMVKSLPSLTNKAVFSTDLLHVCVLKEEHVCEIYKALLCQHFNKQVHVTNSSHCLVLLFGCTGKTFSLQNEDYCHKM